MKKQLVISEDLSLPLDAATQTIAVIARKGAGKTYAASKLAEEFLEHGVQTVVMDTVGNWYGLRIAANGKDRGFDIPVLGGLRGDAPLTPDAGALIADLLVDTGRSFIVDLSQFSLTARKKFAFAFGEQLWKRKKAQADPSPVHVFLEECQLIVPQFVGRDDARMVGIWEEIIRLGRNYGIGVTMITQRPQSVNKEVLTQTECLLVLQVNGVPERKALKEWIVHQGASVDLLNELPGLPVGTAYLWSPQWLRKFERIRIAKKITFDASATPKVGERRVRAELKPLDLDDLKARMTEVTQKAEQNDPTALHKRVRELEVQLERAKTFRSGELQPKVETKTIEVPAIDPGLVARIEKAAAEVRDGNHFLHKTFLEVMQSLNRARENQQELAKAILRRPPALEAGRKLAPSSRSAVAREARSEGGLSDYGRMLLETIARRHPMKLTRAQISILSGRSPRSSAFAAAMAELLREQCLKQLWGGLHELTPEGIALAGEGIGSPQSTDEVLAQWRQALPAYERSLLDALVDVYPRPLTRPELAERTGKSLTSSAFAAAISALSKNGLAEIGSGEVKASETLFMATGAA